MSLAPSKWCVWPFFQSTVATQAGYLDTTMPHTGHRSIGAGLGTFTTGAATPGCPAACTGARATAASKPSVARRFSRT